MNKLVLQPHEEIRVELIRLYLDPEHPKLLKQLQEEVQAVTNHIVRGRKDVKAARIAYARKHALVSDPPAFPEEPSLPKPQDKEANKAVKAAWDAYGKAYDLVSKEYSKWLNRVFEVTKDIKSLDWRKDSYKDLRQIYGRVGSAVLYRDTVKRVNATKRARAKKNSNQAPLVFGNSPLVETGSFYGDRRGSPFYNALVKAPGIPPILGRLRRPLPGKQVQGVTLTRKADGWYAAVKCIVPKRRLPEPVLSPIGLDVGQTDLVALSDGYTERNTRDTEFLSIKAAIQEKGDRSADVNVRQRCRSQVARLDQSRKRRIVHWINSELLPRLQRHSAIFVEKLAKGFKSNCGPLSCIHMILDAVKARFGDRVREVPCAYTSQECSHCGNLDKIARKGKIYACTSSSCGLVSDADVNAARNILRRGLNLLQAA